MSSEPRSLITPSPAAISAAMLAPVLVPRSFAQW
jgi:hypothetical protein